MFALFFPIFIPENRIKSVNAAYQRTESGFEDSFLSVWPTRFHFVALKKTPKSLHMTILDEPITLHAQAPVQTLVYASFAERVVARLIDVMILIIPAMFIPFIFPWLYYAFQEGSSSGATLGKRIMGIRVLSVEGKDIGFGTATGRFFANFLNAITLFIGYLLMLGNARSQCLHDMITSTVVVKTNSIEPITRAVSAPAAQRPQKQQRSWSREISDTEAHFIEMDEKGGKYWHRSTEFENSSTFTLWQLTDGMVDFSAEMGPEVNAEMKQFAEMILRRG